MNFIIGLSGQVLTDAEKRLIKHDFVTGCVFLGPQCQSLDEAKILIESIRSLKPNLDIMLDHEGGEIIRFKEDIVQFNSAASWLKGKTLEQASDLMSQTIKAPLALLREVGFDRILAPCIDIHSEASTIIGQRDRAFSSRMDEIVVMAQAWVAVCEKVGLKTCLKHWPGHGASSHDSHIELAYDHRDSDKIWSDAASYKRLIEAGYQDAVMPGHVIYPDIDHLPATLSHKIIAQLRKWGFKGQIMTDCFSMSGAGDGSLYARAVLARQAGITDFMILSPAQKVIELLDQFDCQSVREN